MTKKDWTQNKFWQERKNDGQFKIEFYSLSNRGNKNVHTIFERPTIEACQLLVAKMGKWGKVIEGNYNKGWTVYSPDFSEVIAGDMYYF